MHGCPVNCLSEVGRCSGEVRNVVNVFGPILALIGHKYGMYFYGTG